MTAIRYLPDREVRAKYQKYNPVDLPGYSGHAVDFLSRVSSDWPSFEDNKKTTKLFAMLLPVLDTITLPDSILDGTKFGG